MLWNVWRVFYGPADGYEDIPQMLVAGDLSFEAARKMVAELGFGHCMKPET